MIECFARTEVAGPGSFDQLVIHRLLGSVLPAGRDSQARRRSFQNVGYGDLDDGCPVGVAADFAERVSQAIPILWENGGSGRNLAPRPGRAWARRKAPSRPAGTDRGNWQNNLVF